LQGQSDRALSLLAEAVGHGLPAHTALRMDQDPDLVSLRDNPRFVKLVAEAKQNAANGTTK
jgi:hypothetical protein